MAAVTDEVKGMEEVMHLLETKLSCMLLSASALVQPHIPALCEQLIILVLYRQIKRISGCTCAADAWAGEVLEQPRC